MNAKKLHEKIVRCLYEAKKIDLQEAKLLAYYLMDFLYEIDKTSIALEKEVRYEEKELMSYLHRLLADEPIQYITQKAYFYDMELSVNEHTLIPRPETEELVGLILKKMTSTYPLRIADIGTGSGCIPIALARQQAQHSYFAIDISGEALEVARRNAAKYNVRILFFKHDILTNHLQDFSPLHILISNPPYICLNEKAFMSKNVIDYEPHLALFVPDEKPLLFYEKIAAAGLDTLVEGGHLFFEINQQYGSMVQELLTQIGYHSVALHKDISGNDRFVVAVR